MCNLLLELTYRSNVNYSDVNNNNDINSDDDDSSPHDTVIKNDEEWWHKWLRAYETELNE